MPDGAEKMLAPIKRKLKALYQKKGSSLRQGWIWLSDPDVRKRIRREVKAHLELKTTPHSDERPVVLAFVNNPGINDSRVLKQAMSLRDEGYRVILYAARHPAWPNRHIFKGIEVRRFDMFRDPGDLEPDLQTALIDLFGPDWEATNETLALLRDGSLEKEARRMASRQVSFLSAAAAMYRLELVEKPIIVHSHDLYPLAGAILLARRTGAKVVFDAHEIETERMPPMTSDLKAYVDRVERRLLSKTDGVIVCCDAAADFYKDRFPRTRPSVVMNAPTIARLQSFDLRRKCGIDRQTPLVIYTGGVGREGRGLHLALEALMHLPTYHLAILGPRHPNNDRWLLRAAQATKTRHRVHLLPPVRPQHVVSAIRGADVGICLIQDVTLSYRYAMPNKLFEMAFAGIPLVVSDLPEMGRFVRENGVGLTVNQTDPHLIAEGIKDAYARRTSYAPDQRRLETIIQKYAWSVQAQKLSALYRSLVNDGNV